MFSIFKRFGCFFGILFLPVFLFAQSLNNEGGSQAKETTAEVNFSTKNVLYKNVGNEVVVTLPENCNKPVKTLVSNGSLKKTEIAYKYKIRVNEGDKTTLSLIIDESGKPAKQIYSKTFQLRDVPYPKPEIMGKRSGNISKEKLKQADSLQLINHFDVILSDVQFEVVSYKWNFIPKEGDFKMIVNDGPSLPTKIQAQLEKAKSQDRIIFQEIKVKGPNGIKTIPQSIMLQVP